MRLMHRNHTMSEDVRRSRAAGAIFLIKSSGSFDRRFIVRVTQSIPLECSNHLAVIGEQHLRHIVSENVSFYSERRLHQRVGEQDGRATTFKFIAERGG